jgi:hypothetical protein
MVDSSLLLCLSVRHRRSTAGWFHPYETHSNTLAIFFFVSRVMIMIIRRQRAHTHTHTQTRWSQSRTRSPSSDRPLPPRSYLTITSDRLAERIRIIIIKRSLVNVTIQRNYLKPTHTHAVASTGEGGKWITDESLTEVRARVVPSMTATSRLERSEPLRRHVIAQHTHTHTAQASPQVVESPPPLPGQKKERKTRTPGGAITGEARPYCDCMKFGAGQCSA